jgi:alkanesulfonate monooxygenase SsuD/methylene tetrahydromethanopterin reductase-like flavin-dependent oxidoreductase (luciferase family)
MQNVKFGIRIPAFPFNDSRKGEFRDEILNYLTQCDGKFDSVWVADHFVPWYEPQDPMTDTLECWTSLTYLAGVFSSYDFGSIVMSQSYRNPALLAKMGATLQTLSNGRFILGIGAGWKEDEYLAYGYDYPSTATRIHQMGEAVQIIKAMWTESQASFQGKYYKIENAICEPKPDPVPPILIGGGGKKITLHYVAQFADWWNFPGGTPENYAELLDALQGHCSEVGRNYNSIIKTWGSECVAAANTREEATEIASSTPLYNPDTAIVGTPDEAEAQLRRFTEMDVEYFILRFADFPNTASVEIFASEVIPRF